MYDKKNLFYKIINREVETSILYEDRSIIVIKDINPKSKTHLLLIPKQNYCSLSEFLEKNRQYTIGKFFNKILKVTKVFKIKNYQIVINEGESQEVNHLHVHILSDESI